LIKYSKFRKFLVRRAMKDSLDAYINLTVTVAAGSSRCKSGLCRDCQYFLDTWLAL